MLMPILQAVAAAVAFDCSAPEHRQLDFWIGRWTVVDAATGQPVGRSVIAPAFKGCAVQESFEDPGGFVGGSLNMWDRARREWVQFGTGSTGARRLFTGRWDGTRIVLLTQQDRADAPPLLIRMYLQPLADGEVRQRSDMSSDYGATWRLRYEYVYRRAD
jgi:hypothetical protein